MAPKKKEQQQKMSLGAFLTDEKMGSWADEMEDMPVYSRTGYGSERRTYNSATGTFGSGSMGGYSVREELPLPDKPPYTVHLGNLSFDATVGDVTDFFAECECTNVRIIEDKLEMKPKGFGYAEFASLDGLKQALTLNGAQFQGRNIRISVADPPKDRDRPDAREITDWSRKGPLPDLPGRSGGGERRERGFGSDFGGGERRERDFEGDGKVRDFGNWTRRGPLSPLPQQERGGPREGGRPRSNDEPQGEGFRDRRASPAQWGEGRPSQGSQDGGSRPPRREFQERPVADRTPTAADQDNQWRAKMKPDQPAAKSPIASREGSEAPSSPALASAGIAGRPKLNLAKRTVSEAPEAQPSAAGDAKASPFGAARPIDTAAKEREIEEKRLAAIKEKKEAEEKAREEKKEAAKAAKAAEAAEAEKQEAAAAEAPAEVEGAQNGEATETANESAEVDDKAGKPKETLVDAKPKPAESGAWRRPSGPAPPAAPRGGDDAPRGPRGGRGGRGGGGRGRYHDEGRGGRQNSNGRPPAPANQAAQAPAAEPEAAAPEDDGWSTVSKPKKSNRGGPRAIVS